MKKIWKILFVLAIPPLVLGGLWFDRWYTRMIVGEPAKVTNDIGKPYAVLTIDYGEPPEGFREGEFYVLKCLKIRGTKIDYGFCPIERDSRYTPE